MQIDIDDVDIVQVYYDDGNKNLPSHLCHRRCRRRLILICDDHDFVDPVGLGSAAQPCCVCTEFRKLWPITYWRNSTQPQTNVNGLRSSLAKERVWCFLVDTVDQGLCWYYTTDVVIVVIDLLFRFPSYCDHLASVYRTTSLQTMQVALFHFISLCLKHFYH